MFLQVFAAEVQRDRHREDACSLVALLAWRDLLFCAKHLFIAAIGGSSTRHWRQDSRPTWPPWLRVLAASEACAGLVWGASNQGSHGTLAVKEGFHRRETQR